MRRRWRWGNAVRVVVAKLISYLIFITYLVSFSFLFRFHSSLASISLDIYFLFVDKSVSLPIRSLTTLCYVPHDSHSPAATLIHVLPYCSAKGQGMIMTYMCLFTLLWWCLYDAFHA
jgi:hypothetical protein